MISIIKAPEEINCLIELPYSKSLINRMVILSALSGINLPENFKSDSTDVLVLKKAIREIKNSKNSKIPIEININDAGTAARFLTSMLAITEGEWILKGSERMNQRPIKPLVDALNSIGADIKFADNNEYFPLNISGKTNLGKYIKIDASQSSQFVSSLMLIAPFLPDGLEIEIIGKSVSKSYINNTVKLLQICGIEITQKEHVYIIKKGRPNFGAIKPERDWSAAAYWAVIALLTSNSKIEFSNLSSNSLQGDSAILSFLKPLGLAFSENQTLTFYKEEAPVLPPKLEINLINHPDLFPPLAVFFAIKGISIVFFGLDTLNSKESRRINAVADICSNVAEVKFAEKKFSIIKAKTIFPVKVLANTHNDHRIAMAYSLLAFAGIKIEIPDPKTVNKSYPKFWEDLENAGFVIK